MPVLIYPMLALDSEIPEITEIDELQTFIGNKKNKVWLWTLVNHSLPGIILWTIGDARERTRSVIAVVLVFRFYGQLLDAGTAFGM